MGQDYSILCFRRIYWSSSHSRERISSGCDYQEAGIIRGQLTAGYLVPHTFSAIAVLCWSTTWRLVKRKLFSYIEKVRGSCDQLATRSKRSLHLWQLTQFYGHILDVIPPIFCYKHTKDLFVSVKCYLLFILQSLAIL